MTDKQKHLALMVIYPLSGGLLGWSAPRLFGDVLGITIIFGVFTGALVRLLVNMRRFRREMHRELEALLELAKLSRGQVAALRDAVRDGAGHECDEWLRDGQCVLCGRVPEVH